MNYKKICATLSVLLLILSVLPITVSAEEYDISKFELPTPKAPVYMMFEAADRTATEGNDALYIIRQTDMSVLALSSEEYSDRDAFLQKYGLYSFCIVMQYDTSLDGEDDWNYTPEWDSDYSAPTAYEACPIAWIGGDMMDRETLFDLYACEPEGDSYSKLSGAIIRRDVPDGDYEFNNYYFDYENHSLYVRVRYYMEWETYDGETVGERQSKYSEWSDAAVFGKNGTAVTPTAPEKYEAPIISDLKFVSPGEGYTDGSLTYVQNTPEQVWNSGIYYIMTGDGYFDGLETEISIDGGDWQTYNTANAWGDWCLYNGMRTVYYEEPKLEADSNIKLRVRFAGSHGPSEWSNVIELNGGGTQIVPEDTHGDIETKPVTEEPSDGKCSLCGFCPVPFGLCIFIWLAITLAVIVIIIVIIAVSKPKKCKNCGAKLSKKDKHCPKCGAKAK